MARHLLQKVCSQGCAWGARALIGLSGMLLVACASPGGARPGSMEAPPPSVAATPAAAVPTPAEPVAPPPPTAGQSALADGLQAYQDGRYKAAEAHLKIALKAGLNDKAEVVDANKHLAFVYCMSRRYASCKAAFRAAKAADPDFALSKAEAGHPMWAKTYRSAMRAAK